jgi:hypothetical protein
MYGASSSVASTGLASSAGAGALAATGVSGFWIMITAMAIIMLGVLVMRLRPKDEF